MSGVLDAGIGYKKRLQIDLVRAVCRMRIFVSAGNIVAAWSK